MFVLTSKSFLIGSSLKGVPAFRQFITEVVTSYKPPVCLLRQFSSRSLVRSSPHKWWSGACTQSQLLKIDGTKISHRRQQMSNSSGTPESSSTQEQSLLTQMNIRLVNENNFLSWCRNTYLISVLGVAMITEGTTVLAQSVGVGALAVGGLNLFWGTACHITNLVRLRKVSGMSSLMLVLNIVGSTLHFLLWFLVLFFYVSFLDEFGPLKPHRQTEASAVVSNKENRNFYADD